MSPVDTIRRRAQRILEDLGLSPSENKGLQTLLETALLMDLTGREEALKEMVRDATLNGKVRIQDLQTAIKDEFDF